MSRNKKAELHAATVRILTTLAKWLIKGGVGCTGAIRLMKIAYARAGAELAPLKNGKIVASRVADITGLTRQEIPALLEEQCADSEALSRAKSQQRAQRILAGWHNDPTFQNPDGTPALLPLRGPVSFAELVKRHSGDARVETSFETLQEAKAIRELSDGRLKVCRKTFATSRMDGAGIASFGDVISEHAQHLVDNSERAPAEALFSFRIESGELDQDASDWLKNRIAERAALFGESIELDLVDDAHKPKSDSRGRKPPMIVTLYVSQAVAAGEPPEEVESTPESPGHRHASRLSPTRRKRSH
jgi:hypothetical protein